MPIKRALLISAAAYLATFIVAIIVALSAQKTALLNSESAGQYIWYGGAVFSIVIMAFATWWYFRGASARASLKHGALFGVVAVLVGFVLDIISVLPVGNPFAVLGELYLESAFFISLVIVVLTTATTGFLLKRRHNARVPATQDSQTSSGAEVEIPINDDIAEIADSDEMNV